VGDREQARAALSPRFSEATLREKKNLAKKNEGGQIAGGSSRFSIEESDFAEGNGRKNSEGGKGGRAWGGKRESLSHSTG